MHKALANNYGDAIIINRNEATFWKAKYESWESEIPDRTKQI